MPSLILMYHDLELPENIKQVPAGHRPYVLEPATFSLQMSAVAKLGLPVLTVCQWATGPRPERAILLTFDDGHVSNYKIALPILQKYRLKATFFITAGLIGKGSMMTWEQLRNLQAAGMEIGSHTVTHRPPSTLTNDELRYELVESRRILEDGLGAPVTTISSPTGFFNPRMCVIARDTGYKALCFGRSGVASNSGDLFALNRVAVKREMTEDVFRALLRFDRGTIRRIRFHQRIREFARKILKPSYYLAIRQMLMERMLMR